MSGHKILKYELKKLSPSGSSNYVMREQICEETSVIALGTEL